MQKIKGENLDYNNERYYGFKTRYNDYSIPYVKSLYTEEISDS